MNSQISKGRQIPRQFLFVNKDSKSESLSNDRAHPQKFSRIAQHAHSSRAAASGRRRQLYSSTANLVGWISKPEDNSSDDTDIAVTGGEPELSKGASSGAEDCNFETPLEWLDFTPLYPSFGNTIDPFNGSAVPMNKQNQLVLEYFSTSWIPAGSDLGRNIAGFTVIGAHDNEIALTMVKKSFSTEVHMLTLLAAAACRMKYISGIVSWASDAPEIYTVKAIQALRKYVKANEPITNEVILDLFFLSLTEFYTKNHTGWRVHYRIMKEFVVKLGGIPKLALFVALLVLSADFLFTASTVTAPAFDFTQDPRLLGIPFPIIGDIMEIDTLLQSIISLEPRLQILIKDNISLAQVVWHIRRLPVSVQSCLADLVTQHGEIAYQTITLPLQIHGHQTPAQVAQARIADRLVGRSRRLAYVVWLWYSAIGFACELGQPVQATSSPATALIASFAAEIRESLKWAENLLFMTNCTVRLDFLLWLNALGVLCSVIKADSDFYLARFVRTAEKLEICEHEQLLRALSVHLPLDQIWTGATSFLYQVMVDEWGSTLGHESSGPGVEINF